MNSFYEIEKERAFLRRERRRLESAIRRRPGTLNPRHKEIRILNMLRNLVEDEFEGNDYLSTEIRARSLLLKRTIYRTRNLTVFITLTLFASAALFLFFKYSLWMPTLNFAMLGLTFRSNHSSVKHQAQILKLLKKGRQMLNPKFN